MSTLAAARADNFYFGPNYDPNGGSLKYQRKMKLKGVRKPSRLDQYKIKSGPKIRFETPFHVKCLNCGHMIAKGVRFNASKREVGHFHSTTILQFSMLCPSCKHTIVCKTDPENCDYRYIEGAVKWLSTENATDMSFLPDPEQKKQEQMNPMFKLEVEVQKVKQNSMTEVLENLEKYRLDNWKDDFEKNLMLRKKFREEKPHYQAIEDEAKKVKNFGLPLEELSKSELVNQFNYQDGNQRGQIFLIQYSSTIKRKKNRNYEQEYTSKWKTQLARIKVVRNAELKTQQTTCSNQKNTKIINVETKQILIFIIMNKYRHSSMHKLLGPPPIVQFDGDETRFSKRIFPEHSSDKIKLCWESRPINKLNDFEFQKVNNTNKEAVDQYTRESYQLPQIYKRKNMLNNECFAISPQTTLASENKFGKYAKRYTQDSDLFSTKIPVHTQYSQHSSAYGQFYFQSDIKLQKTKPIYTYHTAKSQILGNKRLEYIKLRQEAD